MRVDNILRYRFLFGRLPLKDLTPAPCSLWVQERANVSKV